MKKEKTVITGRMIEIKGSIERHKNSTKSY